MKIFIGADHRGFKLKQKAIAFLTKQGYQVIDVGSFDEEPCDYPEISYLVATEVANTKDSLGILVCLTGIGHSIAANKVPGAYAALCYTKAAAALSRQHNNANILVLGAKFTPSSQFLGVIKTWLTSKFEGGRHLRRVKKIKEIEEAMISGENCSDGSCCG